MLISNGDIQVLINWFENKNKKYDLMILYIAGDISDKNTMNNFFDLKETIHAITGQQIIFILFSNKLENLFAIVNNSGEGNVFPGEIIDNNDNYNFRLFNNIDKLPTNDDNIKKSIVAKSISISGEIANYFNISPNDIPCFLVLNKLTSNNLIIPTKGTDDINQYINFFKVMNNFIYENNHKIKSLNDKLYSVKCNMESIELYEIREYKELYSKDNKILEYETRLSRLQKENKPLKIKVMKSLNKYSIDHDYFVKNNTLSIEIKANQKIFLLLQENEKYIEITKTLSSRLKTYLLLVNKISELKNNINRLKKMHNPDDLLKKKHAIDNYLKYKYKNLNKEIEFIEKQLSLLDNKFTQHINQEKKKFKNKSFISKISFYLKNKISFLKDIKELMKLKERVEININHINVNGDNLGIINIGNNNSIKQQASFITTIQSHPKTIQE